MFLVQFFGKPNEQTMTFIVARIFSTCLAYTNSCVNPVLYAFLSENFRKSFRRLIVCRLRTDQHDQPLRLHETRSASACRTTAVVNSTVNNATTAANTAANATCHLSTTTVAGVINGGGALKSAVGVSRMAGVSAMGGANGGSDGCASALLKPAPQASTPDAEDEVHLTTSKTYICTDC